MVAGWLDRSTPPQKPLPRISDPRLYAEAARRDHDERERETRVLYRTARPASTASTLGFVLALLFIGAGVVVVVVHVFF